MHFVNMLVVTGAVVSSCSHNCCHGKDSSVFGSVLLSMHPESTEQVASSSFAITLPRGTVFLSSFLSLTTCLAIEPRSLFPTLLPSFLSEWERRCILLPWFTCFSTTCRSKIEICYVHHIYNCKPQNKLRGKKAELMGT